MAKCTERKTSNQGILSSSPRSDFTIISIYYINKRPSRLIQ